MRVLALRHMPLRREDRLARWLRLRGCHVQTCRPAAGHALPDPGEHDLVVVYGGVQSANDARRLPYIAQELAWIRARVESGGRLLGICLGAQLLARAFGARVERHPQGLLEVGYHPMRPAAAHNNPIAAPMHVFQWHREGFSLPPGSELLAIGETFRNQAFRIGHGAIGLQFHPEVTPAVARIWCREAREDLEAPGAHDERRQRADAERYDRDMGRWLREALGRWLLQGAGRR